MIMSNTAFVTASLTSTILLAPLAFLELRYASQSYSSFPYVLFAVLWLLSFAFVITAVPLVRGRRGSVLGRLAIMSVFAVLWIGIVQDQLPCFLGVPNCD